MKHTEVITHLLSEANETKAAEQQRFFKTGPGEYAEGDIFIGITVPNLRKKIKNFRQLPLPEVEKLLQSKYHEARLFALLLMVDKYKKKKSSELEREFIINTYLMNTSYVNNWDLVDSSAHYMLGPWLEERPRDLLIQLAESHLIWERRIAIMASFHFVKAMDFETTMQISEILLHDKEDLIHKAVGWMLREIGNRDLDTEVMFLTKFYREMPRTMLRYAIEKFPKDLRQEFLQGLI